MANSTTTRLDDLPADFVSFNQGPVAERVAAAMMGISCGFVMLRLAARATRKARLGLDDWIILAALRDNIWRDNNGSQAVDIGHVRPALSNQVYEESGRQPRDRGDALVPCSGTGGILPALLIIIDIIILSLPIREVRRLQIVNWQKAAVCGMFLLGGFVTLVSIVRLKFVAELVNTEPGADTTGNRSQHGDMEHDRGGRGHNVRMPAHAAAADPHGVGLHCPENAALEQQQWQRGARPEERIPTRRLGQPRQSGVDGGQLAASEPRRLGGLVQVRAGPRFGAGPAQQEHPAFRNSFPMGLNIMPTAKTGAHAAWRSTGPLTLQPIRPERPISLGLQGILRKSYM
ncbi:hypothetical protein PG991_002648 [Apiospora marii]|uniref:Rhodopsin domain-containing protein n=1 Tax=Apiospora marii TaxID=335849 RepID=A0ABR1SFZ8_9PEZI